MGNTYATSLKGYGLKRIPKKLAALIEDSCNRGIPDMSSDTSYGWMEFFEGAIAGIKEKAADRDIWYLPEEGWTDVEIYFGTEDEIKSRVNHPLGTGACKECN